MGRYGVVLWWWVRRAMGALLVIAGVGFLAFLVSGAAGDETVGGLSGGLGGWLLWLIVMVPAAALAGGVFGSVAWLCHALITRSGIALAVSTGAWAFVIAFAWVTWSQGGSPPERVSRLIISGLTGVACGAWSLRDRRRLSQTAVG